MTIKGSQKRPNRGKKEARPKSLFILGDRIFFFFSFTPTFQTDRPRQGHANRQRQRQTNMNIDKDEHKLT